MDLQRFWSLVNEARGGSEPLTPSADPIQLRGVLEKLSQTELSSFGLMFYEKLCDLNSWSLWGAGYVLAGGMSDDSFHYFRSWIIGKGQSAYETALSNPDQLADFVEDDCDFDNELLEYVAVEISEERGEPDPRDNTDRFPDDEPEGEPWDEETVHEAFPHCLEVAKRLGNWE